MICVLFLSSNPSGTEYTINMSDFDEIKSRLEQIREYSYNDFDSYKVIKGRTGKCSVGMISHALAVIDYLSYFFYGDKDHRYGGEVGTRWLNLLNHPDRQMSSRTYSKVCEVPEWKEVAENHNLMYNVIRNGVVHQFYGKGTSIARIPLEKKIFVKNSIDDSKVINADALFRLMLDLLDKSLEWLNDLHNRNNLEIMRIRERVKVRDENDANFLNNLLEEGFNLTSQIVTSPSSSNPPPV